MTKEGSNVGAQISPEKLALNFVYGKRAHLKAYEPRFWTLFLNIHRHKDRIFRLTPAAFVQHFLTVIVKDIQTKDIPDNRKEYFAKHFPERSMAGRYLDECKRRRCKQTIFYRYINYMLYITSRGNLWRKPKPRNISYFWGCGHRIFQNFSRNISFRMTNIYIISLQSNL